MMTHWRDTIQYIATIRTDERDGDGNYIYEDVDRTVKGDVSPINSDDNIVGTPTGIVTRFRFVVPADVDLGSSPAEAKVYWINGTGASVRYQPDGGLELNTLNGRPHHAEFIAKRYS